jgi:subtilisin family serine protease
MSYVLNIAMQPHQGSIAVVFRAVEEAGGVVVQAWPQIGVVVAHSTRAAFRADVTAAARGELQSVGATRTVAVREGTPSHVAPSVDTRAATSPPSLITINANLPAERTPATTTDHLENEQWDMQQIKADQAHRITDGSRRVLVGVLDSGIDPDHPDLAPNLDTADSVDCTDAGRPDFSATGWYPGTSDHGTHVAGTIAAARNGIGIVGVAPHVRIASVKVLNNDGFIYPEYAVCGFMWAGLKKMDVTNNSYFVDPWYYWCDDQPDQLAGKEAVRRAVAWATEQGVVHAAAAGNETTDLSDNAIDPGSPNDSPAVTRTINIGCQDIPAELDGVATVSATNRDGQLAYFSNRGLGIIDVAAPGRTILSTVVANHGYDTKSGTSMASPHVAGVLALMKSVHPDWTPAQLLQKLRGEADDHVCSAAEPVPAAAPAWITNGVACVGSPADNSYYGEGIVDALDAVS